MYKRQELTLSDRTLSAYINALAGAGFAVERLEEEPEEDVYKRQSLVRGLSNSEEIPVVILRSHPLCKRTAVHCGGPFFFQPSVPFRQFPAKGVLAAIIADLAGPCQGIF